MRLALIADTFPPLRNSGAVQLRDLAREFARQGHNLTVILPTHELTGNKPYSLEIVDGVQILRLRAPKTKDISHLRRTLAELAMPFAMLRSMRASPISLAKWDGVIWYSPSIFHAPLVNALKKASGCRSYLIIRDIFPEWAVDMGLMGRGPTFRFFKAIASHQYSVADVIGVQSEGNLQYFDRWHRKKNKIIEVLPNWLGPPGKSACPIDLSVTPLAGRTIYVYAGNMGVAQNMDLIINAADILRNRTDVGFLMVGRGSERNRLESEARNRNLENVLFFDEIDPDAIPDLYRQCHVGIVSLDPRHKSHNIPGKFLTYMQCGLPVLANVNQGNDLAKMVRDSAVGEVSEGGDPEAFVEALNRLQVENIGSSPLAARCSKLFTDNFSATAAVDNIVERLNSN